MPSRLSTSETGLETAQYSPMLTVATQSPAQPDSTSNLGAAGLAGSLALPLGSLPLILVFAGLATLTLGGILWRSCRLRERQFYVEQLERCFKRPAAYRPQLDHPQE